MQNPTKPTFLNVNRESGISLDSKKGLSVQIMTIDKLRIVMHWAAQEGWNPGKYEIEALHQADPTGYRLLCAGDEPIAALAGVKHSANFAFLGLYIVKPEYRGKGYGKLLWDFTLNTLKNCGTIGLNGVMNQVAIYANSEFKPATLNARWRGKAPKKLLNEMLGNRPQKKVILTTEAFLTNVVDYDTKIFSTQRTALLAKWLIMPKSHALFAVENGMLKGYGVISVTTEGYKIAPLFADDEEIAERLYVALCQYVEPNAFIYLDTNENNPSAAALTRRLGLEKTFETLRMYKGEAPKSDDKRVFGLTSLEIG